MNAVAVWFVIGMAVGLVSLVLPHKREAARSILQVASAVAGAMLGGVFGRSFHPPHAAPAPGSYGFGTAFAGALLVMLLFLLVGGVAAGRRAER